MTFIIFVFFLASHTVHADRVKSDGGRAAKKNISETQRVLRLTESRFVVEKFPRLQCDIEVEEKARECSRHARDAKKFEKNRRRRDLFIEATNECMIEYQELKSRCEMESPTPDGFEVAPNGVARVTDLGRTYAFNFFDASAARTELLVSDKHGKKETESQRSRIIFFPRAQTPYYVETDDGLEVTLGNWEVLQFRKMLVGTSGKERQVLVLEDAESVLQEIEPFGNRNKAPQLKYVGSGVMVRADFRYQDSNSRLPATIVKGDQTCSVPRGRMFRGRNFIFADDQEFDQFLKRNCKFSLFD